MFHQSRDAAENLFAYYSPNTSFDAAGLQLLLSLPLFDHRGVLHCIHAKCPKRLHAHPERVCEAFVTFYETAAEPMRKSEERLMGELVTPILHASCAHHVGNLEKARERAEKLMDVVEDWRSDYVFPNCKAYPSSPTCPRPSPANRISRFISTFGSLKRKRSNTEEWAVGRVYSISRRRVVDAEARVEEKPSSLDWAALKTAILAGMDFVVKHMQYVVDLKGEWYEKDEEDDEVASRKLVVVNPGRDDNV